MSVSPLHETVVFIVFNRPGTTAAVFERIRAAQPERLLVIADGPRSDRPNDVSLCRQVREICQRIDWNCDAKFRFSDTNLGCRKNVLEGLAWVFSQVERAIILEDDCVPDSSFFPFCSELLTHYQDDPHVGMISGDHFLDGNFHIADSYYYSRFCHIWGWATWRRAWERMDPTMSDWPTLRKNNWLENITGKGPQLNYWKRMLDDSHANSGGLNTWDVAWQYACWKSEMACIIPQTNLVKNLGFDANATHTKADDRRADMSVTPMKFPLQHPKEKRVFKAADDWSERHLYYGFSPAQRVFWSLRLPISIRSILNLKNAILRFLRPPKPHR